MRLQNYHKHTYFSNCFVADCTVSYDDYVKRAKELGHKVISSVEHGFQGNYYVPYELVQNNNEKYQKLFDDGEIGWEELEKNKLKFVFGVEAYWVKDRKKEYPVIDKETGQQKLDKDGNPVMRKDRSNCHIVLLAKNEEGRRDINEALAEANLSGYYGQPRLDMELLLKIKPENVFVTTACIAYWKYDDILSLTTTLFEHFGKNFYLEVQNHRSEQQKTLNKNIISLGEKYGIDIIFGYDSHYIYPEDAVERDNYVATRRKGYVKEEDEESGWYMDYCDEETVRQRFREQGVLTEEQIDRAIKNTDKLLEFDDLYFDKEVKLPSSDLSLTQEQKDQKLRDLVYSKWNEIKPTVDQNRIAEYEDGIEYELNAIIDTHMADYFLIDYQIIQRGIANGGIVTKTGRGSAVSYYVNSLLGFSNIDRFISPVKLYPDRFMSKTRILSSRSLPDIDMNLGNPEIFAQAQDDVMTDIYGNSGHAYPMISYKPLQASSAFKLYAKSQGLDFDTANEVTSEIAAYEKALKHADSPEEKEEINIYDFVNRKYHSLLDESKKYQGIINAKSQAPCGYLIYGGDIKREIGLIRCVSSTDDEEGSGNSVITTVIDGMIAENYKFVKNDLLKVDVWLTINKIFDRIGINTYTVPEITKILENDPATWKIYENGYTLGINQTESAFGRQCCMRYKPKNMQELTALVAALRPGFKTQLQNFLDRKPYSNGVKDLDDILEDSFHYVMYQENIMTYLGWLGIEQTETYAIIKKISKKKFKDKELAELKAKLIESWKEHTGSEDGFEKTWEIMEAFSKYAFNASHAYSYAYDSVYGAFLKAHYPYEFYATMMEHLSEKGEKDKVAEYKKEMQVAFGIRSGNYRFGLDNRHFTIDKEHKYINPSFLSVKSFSNDIAETLYQLGKNKYESFIDLLEDFALNGIADSRISDLIKINYFNDFGSISYLLQVQEIFNKFYKNKKWGVQLKKDSLFEKKIDFDFVRKYAGSETPKQFNKVDTKGLVKELIQNIKDYGTRIHDLINYNLDILGYTGIIDKKYTGYCVCVDVDTKYSPKLKLYALANGNTIPVKINKKIFEECPVRKGDIVHVNNQTQQYKKQLVDGKWVQGTEKEWWITSYEIRNSLNV